MSHITEKPLLDVLLKLDDLGEGRFRSREADTNYGGEVFGGQYLGLAVSAAMRTAPERTPHAVQSFFLRAARASEPVDYVVETTRDGRSFAHRRVSAVQAGCEVFRAEVSFHQWEDDQPAHGVTAPHIPPTTALPTLIASIHARAKSTDPVTAARVLGRRSFDIHSFPPDMGLDRPSEKPEYVAWVRPNPAPQAGDCVGYYASLAYLTDACANFACRIAHAPNLHGGHLLSTSLNHAIWFHATPCPIDTVLYALDSPFSGGGCGLNRGTLFDAGGRIIASVVQEALIRRRR